jgi:hypothetical protein
MSDQNEYTPPKVKVAVNLPALTAQLQARLMTKLYLLASTHFSFILLLRQMAKKLQSCLKSFYSLVAPMQTMTHI